MANPVLESFSDLWFMQLNPARGRKLPYSPSHFIKSPRFMQLNPARGRKRASPSVLMARDGLTVYAAQPREGTETWRNHRRLPTTLVGFMQLNPARGRKLRYSFVYVTSPVGERFMQLNPARGRKRNPQILVTDQIKIGLCSSTPRGDGNSLNEYCALSVAPVSRCPYHLSV